MESVLATERKNKEMRWQERNKTCDTHYQILCLNIDQTKRVHSEKPVQITPAQQCTVIFLCVFSVLSREGSHLRIDALRMVTCPDCNGLNKL